MKQAWEIPLPKKKEGREEEIRYWSFVGIMKDGVKKKRLRGRVRELETRTVVEGRKKDSKNGHKTDRRDTLCGRGGRGRDVGENQSEHKNQNFRMGGLGGGWVWEDRKKELNRQQSSSKVHRGGDEPIEEGDL